MAAARTSDRARRRAAARGVRSRRSRGCCRRAGRSLVGARRSSRCAAASTRPPRETSIFAVARRRDRGRLAARPGRGARGARARARPEPAAGRRAARSTRRVAAVPDVLSRHASTARFPHTLARRVDARAAGRCCCARGGKALARLGARAGDAQVATPARSSLPRLWVPKGDRRRGRGDARAAERRHARPRRSRRSPQARSRPRARRCARGEASSRSSRARASRSGSATSATSG